MVLDEFNLNHVADRHLKLPEQIFAEAEIALAAIDHEPGAVLDAVDMRQDRRPLGAEGLRRPPWARPPRGRHPGPPRGLRPRTAWSAI